jgi:hypothetical protein
MNKDRAIELLNQIVATCQSLIISGFYTRPIWAAGSESVELRLITTLDTESRKRLTSLVSSKRLKIVEEKGLVIIFEPWVS